MTVIPRADLVKGLALGLTAIALWGAWPLVTAAGVGSNLSPLAVTFLRYMVAGAILAPFAFRGDMSLKGWAMGLFFAVMAGAPNTWVAIEGLTRAPASHGGLVIPAFIMIGGMAGGHIVLADRMTPARYAGAALMLLGLGVLAVPVMGDGATLEGEFLYALAGIGWAIYSVCMKRWGVDALTATARLAFLSALMLAPLWPMVGDEIMAADRDLVLFQAGWQGFLSTVIAFLFFSLSVTLIGASRASVLNAATPAVTLILAALFTESAAGAAEWAALLLLFAGMGAALAPTRRAVPAAA
ncbi:DMT family transporter [Gimibacter soli]|uniref:DMT family transporter n=1 Tax=Gimibacter soli TaxID=3024400 RepID=A0AAE9XW26_9PROT|nr:DMT family transporter [Gimibacter soli]WCL54204.1 DMT family transporter [Gimibacter soli]